MRILFLILSIVLALGCVAGQPESWNETVDKQPGKPEAPKIEDPITVSGDGVTVITIRTAESGGRWRFPLQNYTDEFVGVGFHSDSFVKLDHSHIGFLHENESIWLTPMLDDEQGMLFNAIYANEISGCEASQVNIVGKTYRMDQLENGSAFEFDEKWKVAHEYERGCLARLIIYMDGAYFSLGSNEQIRLFRNDNTILFMFENLGSSPAAKVIATKPV